MSCSSAAFEFKIFLMVMGLFSYQIIVLSKPQASERSSGAAIIGKQSLTEEDLTLLGILIGRSSFKDVMSTFGSGKVFHEGEAGTSLYLLCYRGMDGTIVTFESGELGGDQHLVLTGSIHSSKTQFRLKDKCIRSSKVSKSIHFESGLRFGITKQKIEEMYGVPTKVMADHLTYSFHFRERMNGAIADVIQTLELKFQDGKTTEIIESVIETL